MLHAMAYYVHIMYLMRIYAYYAHNGPCCELLVALTMEDRWGNANCELLVALTMADRWGNASSELLVALTMEDLWGNANRELLVALTMEDRGEMSIASC